MRPKASWAGLICRTCLHLKRQILPHNGQLNVPADQCKHGSKQAHHAIHWPHVHSHTTSTAIWPQNRRHFTNAFCTKILSNKRFLLWLNPSITVTILATNQPKTAEVTSYIEKTAYTYIHLFTCQLTEPTYLSASVDYVTLLSFITKELIVLCFHLSICRVS